MKRYLNFLAIAVLITACSRGNDIEQNIISNIDAYKKNHNLNAIYEVKHDTKVIAKGAAGYYSVEENKMLSADEVMPIASGTKQMTAALVLKMQEQGKLNVHDTIRKYLENLPEYFVGDLPAWADEITIHQLLCHTSGLVDYIPGYKIEADKTHKEVNQGIINYAISNPLTAKPGERYGYTNTGYVILGLIVENLSGKDLATLFKDDLFSPLNLSSTYLIDFGRAIEYQQGKLSTFPSRYFSMIGVKDLKFIDANNMLLAPYADGGVVSNIDDITNWTYALHNGKVLSDASYKQLVTPYALVSEDDKHEVHMGYGMMIVKSKASGDVKFYMHGGRAVGIRGEYAYTPQDKITISIMSNVYNIVPKDDVNSKIDYNDPINQIDIKYFLQSIINSTTQDKVIIK